MSDELLYLGHGQIEIYPINSSIINIIGHELRHENFNKYIAFLTDKKVSQDVKITFQFKNGQLYPDKAYTEARFKNKVKKEEIILKILFLKLKLKNLKKNNVNSILVNQYEEELKKLQRDFFKTEDILNVYKFKKDYAKLIGFFRDIYFYQKYNLPPITLNAPFFGDAYKVNEKLQKIYEKNMDNYEFQFKKIINIMDSFQNVKIDGLFKIYNLSKDLNNFLDNYSFSLKKVENENSKYFSVKPTDDAKEGRYKISILNIAKSFIVYSNKYPDIFESLNLSGSPKINGIEIDISTSDSLYDIMEKINWGEDTNHNYQLDEGEDLNSNNELDGGTKQHGVFAYIENNRLYLKNVQTGDIKIDIEDDNNIFHTLGIIAENPYNNEIYFPNVAQNGEDAKIELNGKIYKSHSNVLTVNNLIISISKKIDNADFYVTNNDDEILTEIEKLIDKYNALINKINSYLGENKPLENNYSLLLIKRGLKVAFFNNYSDLTEIGISIKDDKNKIKELELYSNIINELKKFNNSLVDKLYSIGIKSNDDETIIIDRDKLKSAIASEPEKIKNIFLGENGVKSNLQSFLAKVIDKNYGLIEGEINKITMKDLKKLIKTFLKQKGNFNYIVERLHTIEELVGNE